MFFCFYFEKLKLRESSGVSGGLKTLCYERQMNTEVKVLSQEELLAGAKALVAEERKVTLRLIEYLKEIENRLLYLELGFPNMWKFCVLFLGLSEGTTQRRLDAMRLSKKVPEVTNDLETGKLTFSVVSQLQGFFRNEERIGNQRTGSEKKEIVESVHGMSQKECTKKLFEISPLSVLPKEREQLVSADKTELRVILDEKVMEKLRRLKGLLGHRLGHADYGQLIELLADEVLETLEKKKGLKEDSKKKARVNLKADTRGVSRVDSKMDMKRDESSVSKVDPKGDSEAVSRVDPEKGPEIDPVMDPVIDIKVDFRGLDKSPPPAVVEFESFGKRIYIPIVIQRAVWKRSEGCCEFVGLDGRRCMSAYYPELDHRTPVVHGGGNEIENIYLVCKNHNVYLATLKLGRKLMEKYVPSLK